MLALLGGGDLRDQASGLAMTVPTVELYDAFQLAAGLPGWADGICAAAEREIAAGQLGGAAKEWIMSAFGLTRLLMAVAYGTERGPGRPGHHRPGAHLGPQHD